MKSLWISFGTSVALLALASPLLWAGKGELKTVEAAGQVFHTLSAPPHKGIPHDLMQQARAVAVIPHVVKAGLLLDRRFGRGVLLVRQQDGRWGNPLFITLEGGGVGLQAGVESADMVLVFKTEKSLERILRGKGKLTLGSDVAVAVGHLGKEVEVAGLGGRRAEVYAYSRSKGLFGGVSLEGDRLQVDGKANEGFYTRRGVGPGEILALRNLPAVAAVESLKAQLTRASTPPPPLSPSPAFTIVPRR